MPPQNHASARQKYARPRLDSQKTRGGEEREVDHPFRQALAPLPERIGVRQVEVAREVDEQEEREEAEQHRGRPRDARALRRDERAKR